MPIRAIVALLFAVVSQSAVSQRAPSPAVGSADLIFQNGAIYTADSSKSIQAVAVKDGRIVYVGDESGLGRLKAPSTRIVDIGGGLLLPGLHDSHVHLAVSGLGLIGCDLSMDVSDTDVIRHIASCARANPGSEWVTGRGWQLSAFANANPTRAQLDSVVKDRPAFLVAADGHSAWVNSRALELAGISANTPDPAGGRIERDSTTNEPSGTLRESAVAMVRRLVPKPNESDIKAGILKGIALAHSFGITSIHEARAEEAILSAYLALDREVDLNVRVSAAAPVNAVTDAKSVADEVARLEKIRNQFKSDRVRVTAAKIGADGALESRTAALLLPYVGTDNRGPTSMEPDLFTKLITALDRVNFQIHIHSIGDRATRMSLDAIAVARSANKGSHRLHQIAHLQLVDAADIHRFALLNVAANVQGLWAYRDREIRELAEPLLGADRSRHIYPYGSLARGKALLVGGSDWSVTSMNPMAAIQVAVTRRGPRAQPGESWLPDEVVPLEVMLNAYTINGARAQLQEDSVGSITVGKVADLTVLDRDITAISLHEIGKARVRFTFFEGRQVYALDD